MVPAALRDELLKQGKVAVGFSGGVDSTYLVWAARVVLGRDGVLAILADTPSLPRREFTAALKFAEEQDIPLQIVQPDELASADYCANPPDRCYYCKKITFDVICSAAHRAGFDVVVDGSNLDDDKDYRPGMRAMRELGVRSPLKDAGMTKAAIREASRAAGLPTAEKPAMACLASRFPIGSTISREYLAQIEAAENSLRDLGFAQCRVRHYGDLARIELAPESIARAANEPVRGQIVAALQQAGYRHIALDLQGYRMGSLNAGA